MTIQEVQKYIKAHKLDQPLRLREFNDIRSVLYAYLRGRGLKLSDIGKMFNRDHATVINGLNRYNDLRQFADFQENTKHVRAFLEYEVDTNTIDWRQEIIKAETLIDFHRIQTQIKQGLI